MTAAHTGNIDAVKVLLAHHADVNTKGKTFGETALMWAAAENYPAAVAALISADANINARSTVLALTPFKWATSGMASTTLPRGGWTPLMYASLGEGTTALMRAAKANDLSVMKMLL